MTHPCRHLQLRTNFKYYLLSAPETRTNEDCCNHEYSDERDTTDETNGFEHFVSDFHKDVRVSDNEDPKREHHDSQPGAMKIEIHYGYSSVSNDQKTEAAIYHECGRRRSPVGD